MRKLKLQTQITVDGFTGGPEGQLDWMTFDIDKDLLGFINELTDSSDTILLGRKMTPDFVAYWEGLKPTSPEYDFGRKMVQMPKVVFSKTQKDIKGMNLRVESGDLVKAVNSLKQEPGRDIVVYGGASFVSSLIEHDLIDEFNLFVNPVAIGHGLRIFKGRKPLQLRTSTAYPCGVVVNTYDRKA